ncbi:hypothetical protein ACFW35_11245 [Fictibacillus sp. NPDC058756]|uniref:hypothetical protein n=1 Tax=Fictibacillus sp. NPDC058756 TaxID=3346625 RepID=UPI0036ACCE83
MRSILYNNQKVCELTPLEYESLCRLLPYWGLQISEDENISGALSTFTLGIKGLSQQRLRELSQLLYHTGLTITSDDHAKCDQRFYVDFHANHPMPLALNTPDKQLYYLNPATSFRLPVQSAIHKGITLKRKDGPLFLAVQPEYEEKIAEWISYLVIQTFLRFSFESLTSISEDTFMSCAENVLNQVNSRFASVQIPERIKSPISETKVEDQKENNTKLYKKKLPDDDAFFEEVNSENTHKKLHGPKVTSPPIRPFSSAGSLITNPIQKPYDQGQFISRNSQPINPFKPKSGTEHPIQPFKPILSNKKEKSVIRPFQANQHTPSSNREYNNNASRIFRQRRDGK